MKIKYAIIAAVILAATTITSVKTIKSTAPLFEANVEALAEGEESGYRCFNTIHNKDGEQVFYCGTCSWVPGTNRWYSGTSTCKR